jgi:hypothetical protein
MTVHTLFRYQNPYLLWRSTAMHRFGILPVLLGTTLICSTTSNLPAQAFMISGSTDYAFTALSVGGTPSTTFPSGTATFQYDTTTQIGTVILPLTLGATSTTIVANINAGTSVIDPQSGFFSILSATYTDANGSNLLFAANFTGASLSSCSPSACGTFTLSGDFAVSPPPFPKLTVSGSGNLNSYSQAPEPPVTPGLLTLMVLAMKSRRTSRETSIKAIK